MCRSKIANPITISKKDISDKYDKMNIFFKKCIQCLYGEENDKQEWTDIKEKIIELNCSEILQNTKEDLQNTLRNKTGVYIFLEITENGDGIPVYIGVGGGKEKHGKKKDKGESNHHQDLYKRLIEQQIKTRTQTLSKNIRNKYELFFSEQITDEEITNLIKRFKVLVILCGELKNNIDMGLSECLEKILISIFQPLYN